MITGQIKGFTSALGFLTKMQKQTRFAQSRALNDTAAEIQDKTVAPSGLLADKFTLRSKRGTPWYKPKTKLGFNIKYASKTNLEARVGSQADWLKEQEHGGTRRTPSGHRMPIPSPQWKPVKSVMEKAKKPGRILSGRIPAGLSARPFILGGAIYVRTGQQRGPLQRLFVLSEQTRIRAILQWEPRAKQIALNVYQKHYARRLAEAIMTAR